jgi:hypothetical protein
MLNLSKEQFGQHNKMDMDVWYGQAWKLANQPPITGNSQETAAPTTGNA